MRAVAVEEMLEEALTHSFIMHAQKRASMLCFYKPLAHCCILPKPQRAVLQLCLTSHSCWKLLEDVVIPGARLYLPWQGGKHRCLCLFLAILLGTHICCAFLRVLWHIGRTIVWKKKKMKIATRLRYARIWYVDLDFEKFLNQSYTRI